MQDMVLAVYRRAWFVFGLACSYLSFRIYEFGLSFIGVERAAFIAIVAISASMLNELGHWLCMRLLGYRAYVVFLPFLASIHPLDTAKFARRSKLHECCFAMAGPMINYLLMLAGLALVFSGQFHTEGVIIASINAGAVVLNLLPLLVLDGSKYMQVLFDSSSPSKDRVIMLVVLAILGISYVPLALRGRIHPYPFLAVGGTHWSSRKSSPEEYLREGILSGRAVNWLLAWWLFKITTAILVLLTLPTPIHVDVLALVERIRELWHSGLV